jgi:hypothetical protein
MIVSDIDSDDTVENLRVNIDRCCDLGMIRRRMLDVSSLTLYRHPENRKVPGSSSSSLSSVEYPQLSTAPNG